MAPPSTTPTHPHTHGHHGHMHLAPILPPSACRPVHACADDEILRDREIAGLCTAHPQHRLIEPLVKNGAGYAVSLNASGCLQVRHLPTSPPTAHLLSPSLAVSLTASACLQPALQWAYTRLSFSGSGTDELRKLERDYLDAERCQGGDAGTRSRVSLQQMGFLLYLYAAVWIVRTGP